MIDNKMLQAMNEQIKHEQFISGKINDLMKLAMEENDYPAMPMLHWFIDEQMEEETSTEKPMRELEMMGDSKQGLFMLDRELGSRVFTLPTTNEEG